MSNVCELCKRQFTAKVLSAHKKRKYACIPQEKMIKLHEAFHTVMQASGTITSTDPAKKKWLADVLEHIRTLMNDHASSHQPSNALVGHREFGKESLDEYATELEKIPRKRTDFFVSFVKIVYCDKTYPIGIKISSLSGKYCKVVVENQWTLMSFEKCMMMVAKRMCSYMKEIGDGDGVTDQFGEFMVFLYNVTIHSKKELRQFYASSRKDILPLFYKSKYTRN